MKKGLVYFICVFVMGLSVLTACNKDEAYTYPITYKANNFAVTVSGVPLIGNEAVLTENTLTLKNVIPGEPEAVVTVSRNGDKLMGTDVNTYRKLTLDGTISGDKLTLDVAMQITVPLVGKWGINSMLFTLDTDKEYVVFGYPEAKQIPPALFAGLVKTTVGGMLPLIVQNMTLEEDGNVLVSYSPTMSGAPFVTSSKGMAVYNMSGNKIYIAPNVEAIGTLIINSLLQTKSTGGSVDDILAMLMSAFPLIIDLQSGLPKVYVNKEMMLPYTELLSKVVVLLPEKYARIGTMISQFATIVKESNAVELGFVFQPWQAGTSAD
ncbi:MAG: hypothetical protein PARBA_01734 [Parabacteroides sp.]